MTCYCTLQVGCHKEQTAFILWWFEVPVIIRIDLVDQKMNAVCFLVTTYLQSAVAISKETCVCVCVCVYSNKYMHLCGYGCKGLFMKYNYAM